MFTDLENKEIQYILEHNYLGHLGYIYLNRPYVVPITYYFDKVQKAIIGYSGQGHKIIAMLINNAVSLQIEEVDSVTNWKSVLIHGTFEPLMGSSAKANLNKFTAGLRKIILKKEHKKANFISEFSSKIYNNDNPVVFIIKIKELTGKKRTTFEA